MKLKKLIAAASALTLLGSLAAAVPASAAEGSTTVTASVAAQVRSQNEKWSSMHENGTKFVPESNGNNNIETSGKNNNGFVYFSAFYYFDAIDIPEDATIKSATIDITQGTNKFKQKPFEIASVTIPEDLENLNDIWDSVSAVMGPNNKANNVVETKDIDPNGDTTLQADVTSIIDKEATTFAFVAYNKQRDDSNRQLSGTATLTITYEYEETVTPDPTVSIVDGSRVEASGTGEYEDEVATGFIAKVVTKDVAAKSMNVTVNDKYRTAQTITTLTNTTAYFKVIVSDAAAEDSIEVYVD